MCKSFPKEKACFAGLFESPLTDSNRRPPPYHGLAAAVGCNWTRLFAGHSGCVPYTRVAGCCPRLPPPVSINAPCFSALSALDIPSARSWGESSDGGRVQERGPGAALDRRAGEDHTVPASLSKAAYKRYESSEAKTDYLEFEGRPHLHMAAPDWQEVAQAIDSWLGGVLDVPVAGAAQATT
jgi:hypothetical protein